MSKEKPKYKVQEQYEQEFKDNYKSMLLNCCKTMIAKYNKIQSDIKR